MCAILLWLGASWAPGGAWGGVGKCLVSAGRAAQLWVTVSLSSEGGRLGSVAKPECRLVTALSYGTAFGIGGLPGKAGCELGAGGRLGPVPRTLGVG